MLLKTILCYSMLLYSKYRPEIEGCKFFLNFFDEWNKIKLGKISSDKILLKKIHLS